MYFTFNKEVVCLSFFSVSKDELLPTTSVIHVKQLVCCVSMQVCMMN